MTHPDSIPASDEALVAYDAGLLNDHGGGNVEWWQDYIRAQLGRAHDFYAVQFHAREAAAKADAEAANQRAAHAEHRLYSFRQGRAARSKVMADYIKAKCPELWPDYAALSVNGSLYSDDLTIEPVYEREMNTLRHRAETAEDRATAAKADAEMLAGALERIANHRYDAGGAYEMTMIARQALATYREKNNG